MNVIQSSRFWLFQTQTWLYNQIRFLSDDINNHIVCEDTVNLDQFKLPNIHNLSRKSPFRFFFEKRVSILRLWRYQSFLIQTARKENAKILHSHFGDMGWFNLTAAIKANVKHIVTFYGFDVTMLPKTTPVWFERYRNLFASVDGILCEGPFMGKSIERLGCPKEKIHVHHLGVAVDEIEFKPRQWSPGAPIKILIAASFVEKKGIPYALEALGQLQHEVPLEITIIGDASEQPRSQLEKQKILDVIAKHNLSDKIRMLGFQPYSVLLKEAYSHHIFLSPSVSAADGDSEGGAPVTIIEMVASGMPVISTRHCDIPEVILHGKTGLLADERNADELKCHLSWLVNHYDQWGKMIKAGRERIEIEFNTKRQGKKLSEIYINITKTDNE